MIPPWENYLSEELLLNHLVSLPLQRQLHQRCSCLGAEKCASWGSLGMKVSGRKQQLSFGWGSCFLNTVGFTSGAALAQDSWKLGWKGRPEAPKKWCPTLEACWGAKVLTLASENPEKQPRECSQHVDSQDLGLCPGMGAEQNLPKGCMGGPRALEKQHTEWTPNPAQPNNSNVFNSEGLHWAGEFTRNATRRKSN